MPKVFKKRFQSGFTMIELLVVIAIIGVLAAAVLAALNPIEQINRSRDTGRRADAGELVNAIERYYAVKEMYPWNADATEVDDAEDVITEAWLDKMVAADEVKLAFPAKILKHESGTGAMRIEKDVDVDEVYVCFTPLSTSVADEAVTRCDDGLSPTSACGAGVEEICVP